MKKCVEENRDKGEINKTKGEENVAEKKTEKRKEKESVVLVLVIRVVWGKGMNKFFFLSKLMKKNYINVLFKIFLQQILVNNKLLLLLNNIFLSKYY